MKIIIAVDGFAACGKSTIAKSLATELNYGYIDTGAMYRSVTLYFLRNKVNLNNSAEVQEALNHINIRFRCINNINCTFLNGENVESEIRTLKVSEHVSEVAAISAVRRAMVAQQQEMGKDSGIVMDGRDIGTVVFPNAELKLFLTAQMKVRVERRYSEMINKGIQITKEEVEKNLSERDHIDSNREDSPLRQAEDAVLIDNSNISRSEQLAMVKGLVTERIKSIAALSAN